ALVRPVLVGQELAECVGVLDRRRLNRLEAVALELQADGLDHASRRRDLGRTAVGEAARQAGLQFLRFLRFFVHCRAYIADGPDTATSYARSWAKPVEDGRERPL